MLQLRSIRPDDDPFFKMPDVWTFVCEGEEGWAINMYRSHHTDSKKKKAGVTVFDGRVRLTVDQDLWADAKQGCMFSNFTLAHEFGHVALNHHAQFAGIRNFRLSEGRAGMLSNKPPNETELEANYAAVFFQCGKFLEEQGWTDYELARRAYSDSHYVKRARSIVQLGVFRDELEKLTVPRKRVIL
ncbi:MAG: hypothetical protein N838_33510 [Thiohalocapsa sp. PB-PSB1]|nr:MAG: hypothetical protein N838_33510 [Thiohalocapsa sp. PB-PSB1]